ncbi:MAG: UbiA family prenyltransferase [Ignavibacteriaceae bacterium]|nr:UbiA family prenyltransferase [Ignavibacteriaceae bacterium]
MKTIAVSNYPLLSFEFIRAYLITMRPYLLFVSGITGMTGIALSGNNDLIRIILIFIASFLSYGFGQALTDCFQMDTDSISSPYRPLTQGRINKVQVMSISAAGLIFCVSIFSYYNSYNLILGIISACGLVTYTFFKRKWWGGPFYNSWIVALLFLISYYSAAGRMVFEYSLSFSLTIVTVFFGYANFVLSGYFKDISADAATGYITLPVKFGRKVSVVVSDAFALIAAVSCGIIILSKLSPDNKMSGMFFYLFGITLSLVSQIKLHNIKTDEGAHTAISLTVHSYILLLSSVTVMNKPTWNIFLAVYYLLFNIIMRLRPTKYQI